MKIRLISFTAQGAATASRLCEGLKRLRACPPRCGRQDFRETADMRERVEAVRFCDLKESGKSLSDFTRRGGDRGARVGPVPEKQEGGSGCARGG